MKITAMRVGGLLPPRSGVGAAVMKSAGSLSTEDALLDWLLRNLSRWEPGEEIVLTYEIDGGGEVQG